MSAFSNYLEEQIINHWLLNVPASSPTAVYLALFTEDPAENASGAEATYVNYARQQASWTNYDVANGQTKNSAAITFPANGNSTADVTVTHAAIFDALTTGNMLLYGPLASPKTLAVGDVLSFAASALTLTVD